MSDERTALGDLFEGAGWLHIEHKACDGIFKRPEAVVGVVLAEAAADAVARAGDAQAELRDYRDEPGNHYKDAYLVFVVRRLGDTDVDTLERWLDDPYVCRKLLVERRERTLSAAIGDLGLFLPPGWSTLGEESILAGPTTLEDKTWDWLRKRSPAAIADLLIAEEESTGQP